MAVSTFDPAKTLGRWWLGSKERYYAVRRRQAPPGPLADLTRAMKYRTDGVAARPGLQRVQPSRASNPARSP